MRFASVLSLSSTLLLDGLLNADDAARVLCYRDDYAVITPIILTTENIIDRLGSALNLNVIFGLTVLALTLLISGHLIWWAERKANPEMFPPSYLDGVDDGLWWSTVTMTTVGYGDKAPITFTGRFIGVAWMFIGLGVYGIFSGVISSILTSVGVSEQLEIANVKRMPDLQPPSMHPICTLVGAYEDYLAMYGLDNASYVIPMDSSNYEDCYNLLLSGASVSLTQIDFVIGPCKTYCSY